MTVFPEPTVQGVRRLYSSGRGGWANFFPEPATSIVVDFFMEMSSRKPSGSTGRGGAGNFQYKPEQKHEDKSTCIRPQPVHRTFSTGRGGWGNRSRSSN
ncbi:hypothetical protein Moror_10364 [Moniliophthora roreri MCA 2997]|uniref:Uncharacterized protein n=1 Tax=Moniliophthora roreri (strain MCA 2997) TaxID=1381753 RepID=V2WYN7_MONRO|nr:hypothetical protein Moror_10364 [Moniliophthora roreri MCA 2997]